MKEDFGLAKKLRTFRLQKGFTLEQLAARTNFNKSYLSKIENAKNTPPIATLSRIAQSLEMSIADFFKEDDADEIFALTRLNERIPVAGNGNVLGHSYESINHKKKRKSFDAFVVTFPVQKEAKEVLFDHEGEEMVYVLQGALSFRHKNNVFVLKKGDCAHFDSRHPHNAHCRGNKEAKALIIICGPR